MKPCSCGHLEVWCLALLLLVALFPFPHHLLYLRCPGGDIPLGVQSTRHTQTQQQTETFQVAGQSAVHSQARTVTALVWEAASWRACALFPPRPGERETTSTFWGRKGRSDTSGAGAWGGWCRWAGGYSAHACKGGQPCAGEGTAGLGHLGTTTSSSRRPMAAGERAGNGRCRWFRSSGLPCGLSFLKNIAQGEK